MPSSAAFCRGTVLAYNINEEGDAAAYVDPEFEEGDYAAILGGELFPQPNARRMGRGKGQAVDEPQRGRRRPRLVGGPIETAADASA